MSAPLIDLPVASPDLQQPVAETVQQRSEPTTVFLTYLSCLGNVQKTAAALMLDVSFVEMLAKREGWEVKVKALLALRKEQGAEALARELNRTVNLVQAVRLRNVIDQIIRRITDDTASFEDFISSRSAKCDNVSMRNMTDLVKACESIHRMTYQALGDSLSERIDRDDDADATTTSLAVLKALAVIQPNDPAASARQLICGRPTPTSSHSEPNSIDAG